MCAYNNGTQQCGLCQNGYYLDLSTYKCVAACSSTQRAISSTNIKNYMGTAINYCRPYANGTTNNYLYYVNSSSTQLFELGTFEFPFKLFESAPKEIFNNIFDYKIPNVTILVARGTTLKIYYQIQNVWILNLNQFIVQTYGNPALPNPRFYQVGWAYQWSDDVWFTLSENDNLVSTRVARGDMSSTEATFSSRWELMRTNALFDSLDLQSLYNPSGLNIATLQVIDAYNNTILWQNSYIDVDNEHIYVFSSAGTIYNNNVVNLTQTQIAVEYVSTQACNNSNNLISYFKSLNCKYTTPTATILSTQSALYFFGQDHFVVDNNTFDNIYWLSQRTRPLIYASNNAICDPTWRISHINITNNRFVNLGSSNNLMIIASFYTLAGGPRQFFFVGNTFYNSTINQQFATYQGLLPSQAYVANNTFINSIVLSNQLVVWIIADNSNVTILNDYIYNSSVDNYYLVQTATNLNVTNITFANTTGLNVIQSNAALISATTVSQNISITNITVNNCSFFYGSSILISKSQMVIMSRLNFYNSSLYKQDLIVIGAAQRLYIGKMMFYNVSKQSSVSDERSGITIQTLNLTSGISNYLIQDTNYTYCQIQGLELQGISTTGTLTSQTEFNFTISNVTFSQNNLKNSDSFIDVEELSSKYLTIQMVNVQFLNNSVNSGSFISLTSNILNIYFNTSIVIGNSGNFANLAPANLNTAVPLIFNIFNSTFTQNFAQSDALIIVNQNSLMYVTNTNFTENYSYGRGSVVFGNYQSAYVLFKNCNILRNYAQNGGVFYTSYSTIIEFQNSTIMQNFGVTGGVGYVNNDGIAYFKNNTILSENQGLNTGLVFQFDCQYTSVFDNVSISQNDQRSQLINKYDFLNINSDWKWFDADFFQSLAQYSDLIYKIIYEQTTDSSITSMKSILTIQNSQVFNNDQLLSASTTSEIIIVNSTIRDLQGTGMILYTVSSSLIMANSIIQNISYPSTLSSSYYNIYIDNNSSFSGSNLTFQAINGSLLYVSESNFTLCNNSLVTTIRDTYSSVASFYLENALFNISHTNFIDVQSHSYDAIFSFSQSSGDFEYSNFSGFNQTLFVIDEGSYTFNAISVINFSIPLRQQTEVLDSLVIDSTNADLYILNSNFTGLRTNAQSPVIETQCDDFLTYNSSLSIVGSLFSNNYASKSAGVIMASNTQVYINTSTFLNNKAQTGSGGVLYLDSGDTDTDISYKIENSVFIGNTASINGGVIYFDYYMPNITNNNTFINNTAAFGDVMASYPVQISLTSSSGLRRLQASTMLNNTEVADLGLSNSVVYQLIDPLVSGDLMSTNITFEIQDENGVLIETDGSSIVTLNPQDPDNVKLFASKSVQAVGGVVTFNDVIIVAQPGNNILLQVQVDTIDQTRNLNAFGMSFPDIYIMGYMRLCTVGEQQTVDNKCTVCSDGFYQLEENQTTCNNCPDFATCVNGYQIIPDAGYWRKDVNSTDIYACLYADACISAYEPTCAPGYSGNLCQVCVEYNGTFYSRGDNDQCTPCIEPSQNSLRLAGVCILIVFYIIVVIWVNIKSAGQQKLTSVYMRILTNYFQIIILASSYQLNWEENLQRLLEALSFVEKSTNMIVSQDCYIYQHGYTLDPVYFQLILVLFLPLFAIVLIVVFWCFAKLCFKQIKLIDNIISSVIVLIFILMPVVSTVAFTVFNCANIFDDGHTYLSANLDIQCWSSEHSLYAKAFGIPTVLVWVIGLPLIAFYILYKRRKQLSEEHNIVRYGFIYVGLDTDGFYWEILIHFRKICIILVNVYLVDMELIFRFATFYGGIYYITDGFPSTAQLLFFFSILAMNVLFLFNWLRHVFTYYYDAAIDYIQKCACMKKVFKKKKEIQEDGIVQLDESMSGSQKKSPSPNSSSKIDNEVSNMSITKKHLNEHSGETEGPMRSTRREKDPKETSTMAIITIKTQKDKATKKPKNKIRKDITTSYDEIQETDNNSKKRSGKSGKSSGSQATAKDQIIKETDSEEDFFEKNRPSPDKKASKVKEVKDNRSEKEAKITPVVFNSTQGEEPLQSQQRSEKRMYEKVKKKKQGKHHEPGPLSNPAMVYQNKVDTIQGLDFDGLDKKKADEQLSPQPKKNKVLQYDMDRHNKVLKDLDEISEISSAHSNVQRFVVKKKKQAKKEKKAKELSSKGYISKDDQKSKRGVESSEAEEQVKEAVKKQKTIKKQEYKEQKKAEKKAPKEIIVNESSGTDEDNQTVKAPKPVQQNLVETKKHSHRKQQQEDVTE